MKRFLLAIVTAAALAGGVSLLTKPKPFDFSNADRIAGAMVGEAQAQGSNINPPVPSVLGVWGTAVLTGTTTANPIAAPSTATTRNYVDQVMCMNANSIATQIVTIYADGNTAATVKGYANCPVSMAAGFLTTFNPPLQLNAGAAVTVKVGTAAASQYVTVHAFQAR